METESECLSTILMTEIERLHLMSMGLRSDFDFVLGPMKSDYEFEFACLHVMSMGSRCDLDFVMDFVSDGRRSWDERRIERGVTGGGWIPIVRRLETIRRAWFAIKYRFTVKLRVILTREFCGFICAISYKLSTTTCDYKKKVSFNLK